MTRHLVAALVLAGTTAIAGAAFAQTETVVQEPDRVVVQSTTIIDFSAVDIEGTISEAGGGYVLAPPRASFASMIPVRGNFVPELERSVEDL